MKLTIRRGLPLQLAGAPEQAIRACNAITEVGLVGSDYPGMRAEMMVELADHVKRGDVIFRDRKRHDVQIVSPVSGVVSEIDMEPGHRLKWVTLTVEGDAARSFSVPSVPDRDNVAALLQESGLWSALRARPFGRIPDPGTQPDAIFVTATDTEPLAADPALVVVLRKAEFARGIGLLRRLTDGPLFVCQPKGEAFVTDDDQIRCVHVAGPHPAGLAGTHIDRLFPLKDGNCVWQMHYQDVMALGHLAASGELPGERIVSLAGPAVRDPRLVRVPYGADLDQLVAGELSGPAQVMSGSPISGRHSRFLGRYHWQVSALARRQSDRVYRSWRHFFEMPHRPSAVIPTEALEHAIGPDIPAVPLLRALSIGDARMAGKLGCLGLVEEDVALLTYAAGGRHDYGIMLRSILDDMEEA